MKQPKLVKITWNDAEADSCWTSDTVAFFKTAPHCETVGYLIRKDKSSYVVTSTITDTDAIMGYTIIPKGLATKVEYL